MGILFLRDNKKKWFWYAHASNKGNVQHMLRYLRYVNAAPWSSQSPSRDPPTVSMENKFAL